MAGMSDVKKDLDDIKKQVDALKSSGINVDTRAMEDALKRARDDMQGVGKDAIKTGDDVVRTSSVIVNALGGANSILGRISQSILEVGRGVMSMGDQFKQTFKGTYIDEFAAGFDELTEMTRSLRTSAVGVGSAFGLSFEQTRGSYNSYIASVLLAQGSTYATRQEIQQQTIALAQLGIGLDDLGKTFQVSGSQQNILTEGFLLAADSGLRTETVFEMMATGMRKMGLSAEDAGKPLIALENIAKSTGLPVQELSNRIFQTAQEGARLGITVDSLSPIIRRFVDVLGPGFKGLAIEETTNIIRGLERQINTTQAAFMAMQGGLARPGAGVAEAQLAFEDAFKNPVEIMKSLQTTLAGVTGGKIIRFEEARANPELANQFKIQRDLLAQLTGNTDPQSQRTLMSILSDLQSGKQLTTTQNKTIDDALKSGTAKQEEQKGLQDRIGKAQVGLLTQISLNTSAMFERLLPPQAQAGFSRMAAEKGGQLEQKGIELFNRAIETGGKLLGDQLPASIKDTLSGAKGSYDKAIAAGEAGAGSLRSAPIINIPTLPGTIPTQSTPTPFTTTISPTPTGAPLPTISTREVHAPGEKEAQHVVVTFRGTDELTRALADAASKSYNKTLHGNG